MIEQEAANVLSLLIALMMAGCVLLLAIPDRDNAVGSVAGYRDCPRCGKAIAPDEVHRH